MRARRASVRVWPCIVAAALVMVCVWTYAGAAPVTDYDILNVYFVLNPPFVMQNPTTGALEGYDVELFDLIVQRLQVERGLEVTRTVVSQANLQGAVVSDPLAVGLGGLAISKAGNDAGEFAVTYFRTGLDVAIAIDDPTVDPLLFFSPFTTFVWITATLCLYISGHVIWFLESPWQPTEFPLSYLRGVNEGCWYCWGILSETGAKDLIGFPSRLYSIGWTTFTLTLLSAYVAQLTTILNAANFRSDIRGLIDLAGEGLAVVIGSDGEKYVRDHLPSVAMFAYPNVTTAFEALELGFVKGFMADASTLEYFVDRSTTDLRMLGSLLTSTDYSVLLPNASPFLDRINTIILELTREGRIAALNIEYFGVPFIDNIGQDDLVAPALTFAAISGVYAVVAIALACSILIWVCQRLCWFC